jgi:Amt family ammonium transporter
MAVMYAVKATGTLRVSAEGEREGLDVHEHGGSAYPELLGGASYVSEASSPVAVPSARMAEMSAK